MFEPYFPVFEPDDLKKQQGVIFDMMKEREIGLDQYIVENFEQYAVKKKLKSDNVNQIKLTSLHFDLNWQEDIAKGHVNLIQYFEDELYGGYSLKAKRIIRENLPRLLNYDEIRNIYLLFLSLGGIGDWNSGNLLTTLPLR